MIPVVEIISVSAFSVTGDWQVERLNMALMVHRDTIFIAFIFK